MDKYDHTSARHQQTAHMACPSFSVVISKQAMTPSANINDLYGVCTRLWRFGCGTAHLHTTVHRSRGNKQRLHTTTTNEVSPQKVCFTGNVNFLVLSMLPRPMHVVSSSIYPAHLVTVSAIVKFTALAVAMLPPCTTIPSLDTNPPPFTTVQLAIPFALGECHDCGYQTDRTATCGEP